MSITVHTPDGHTAEFPDGTDPSVIQAAMAKQFGTPAAPDYGPASDSFFGNLPAAIGQGMTDSVLGARQLLSRVPVPGAGDASADLRDDLDQQAKEKAKLDAPLLAAPGGTTGSIIGAGAMTAPLTFAGGGPVTGVVAKLLSAAGRGAGAGAVGGAVQPVAGDSFAAEKAGQIGGGAVGGAVAGGALSGLGQAAEALLPANFTKLLMNAVNSRSGNAAATTEGERLAEATGVNLTPAQLSGDKTASMAENMARQSIFSRGIANEGDKARVQQLSDYFDKTLQGITASEASPAVAGKQVQNAAKNVIDGLEKWRSNTAAEDFGAIRAMTKGQAAIEPSNTSAVLQQLVADNAGMGTPGGDALTRFAKQQLSNVDPARAAAWAESGTAEAAQAAGATAPAQGNLDKLMGLRSYLSKVAGGQAKISGENQDRRIATQLLQGIDQDIEASADQIGGDLGGKLKLANARYRELSQQIDSVKSSPLGSILGEDVSGALQSGAFNTVAPEKVIEKLSALRPTELGIVRGLLEQDQPQAWQVLKRSMLEGALEKAKQIPPSEGINNPVLRPNVLIKNVGDAKKLQAVFDPAELSQIQAGLDVARRLADRTGYNFSGTAPAGEALSVMNRIKDGGLKAAASAGGAVLGSRALARVMTDSNGRRAVMQLSRLSNLGSERARQLTAQITAIAGAEEGDSMGGGPQN
jgi:hypothetical protein